MPIALPTRNAVAHQGQQARGVADDGGQHQRADEVDFRPGRPGEMGANKITTVALGNTAHSGTTRTSSRAGSVCRCLAWRAKTAGQPARKYRSSPGYAPPPSPQRGGRGGSAICWVRSMSSCVKTPAPIKVLTPRSVARVMSMNVEGDGQDHPSKDTEGQIHLELGHLSALARLPVIATVAHTSSRPASTSG